MQLNLDQFKVESTEVSQSAIDYYYNTYGINILELGLSTREIALLVNFLEYGASRAIMNLINSLQQEQ